MSKGNIYVVVLINLLVLFVVMFTSWGMHPADWSALVRFVFSLFVAVANLIMIIGLIVNSED